ncbi:hypothetical protein CONCODRAFT_71131 [Conidiobolus coronatus NRRL 28638]|uniref:Uncharacterized protein n=1 Tax=Conidiobolus coronatus (strain ATCC 28846 / CBS 209.66 / NRRL 28638) TaxID=796925 RepID=A0A137P4P1_CONC2|nr:hypothetical protein CONCODRAFT_71131 [Conidiobolus coronatus NRRL 28638]|eukprot:KXN69884.1 hypothetical protein CONCODRAFT_71131 [Conidiobolus coronatus NRRL 28638]
MKLSTLNITLLSSISLVASLQPSDVELGTGIHPGDPEPPAPVTEKEVFEQLGGKVPEIDKIKTYNKKTKAGYKKTKAEPVASSWWGIGSWLGGSESTNTAPASNSTPNTGDTYAANDSSSSWFSWVPSIGFGSPSATSDTGTDLIEPSEDSSWGNSILSSFTSGLGGLGSYGASGLGYLGDAGLVGLEYLGSAGLTGLEYAGSGISEAAAYATHPDTLAAVGNALYTGGHALAVTSGVTASYAGNMALSMLNSYMSSQPGGNYHSDDHDGDYDYDYDDDDDDDDHHHHHRYHNDKDHHRRYRHRDDHYH